MNYLGISPQPAPKSRHQIHRDLMLTIYQYLFYLGIEEKPSIQAIFESIYKIPFAQADEFSRGTIIHILKHGPEIIEKLNSLLNNWSFERLGLVEQAILLVAYSEYVYMKLEKAVDMALKLAHKYADDESYKWINGVLDSL